MIAGKFVSRKKKKKKEGVEKRKTNKDLKILRKWLMMMQ